jgi:hypothetical protein
MGRSRSGLFGPSATNDSPTAGDRAARSATGEVGAGGHGLRRGRPWAQGDEVPTGRVAGAHRSSSGGSNWPSSASGSGKPDGVFGTVRQSKKVVAQVPPSSLPASQLGHHLLHKSDCRGCRRLAPVLGQPMTRQAGGARGGSSGPRLMSLVGPAVPSSAWWRQEWQGAGPTYPGAWGPLEGALARGPGGNGPGWGPHRAALSLLGSTAVTALGLGRRPPQRGRQTVFGSHKPPADRWAP